MRDTTYKKQQPSHLLSNSVPRSSAKHSPLLPIKPGYLRLHILPHSRPAIVKKRPHDLKPHMLAHPINMVVHLYARIWQLPSLVAHLQILLFVNSTDVVHADD